jgi:hypothetical protein
MAFWFLMAAAILSLAGMVFHGFIGARIYMGNVNDSNLPVLTKSLSLVSWHVFTVFLLVSGLALAVIAFNPQYSIAAYPVIGVNILGAGLFIMFGLGGHGHLLRLPGAYLMGGTALLALAGIL